MVLVAEHRLINNQKDFNGPAFFFRSKALWFSLTASLGAEGAMRVLDPMTCTYRFSNPPIISSLVPARNPAGPRTLNFGVSETKSLTRCWERGARLQGRRTSRYSLQADPRV